MGVRSLRLLCGLGGLLGLRFGGKGIGGGKEGQMGCDRGIPNPRLLGRFVGRCSLRRRGGFKREVGCGVMYCGVMY